MGHSLRMPGCGDRVPASEVGEGSKDRFWALGAWVGAVMVKARSHRVCQARKVNLHDAMQVRGVCAPPDVDGLQCDAQKQGGHGGYQGEAQGQGGQSHTHTHPLSPPQKKHSHTHTTRTQRTFEQLCTAQPMRKMPSCRGSRGCPQFSTS